MRKVFTILVALISVFNLDASHIVGGFMSYTFVSGTTYNVNLSLYRDCTSSTPFDQTIYIGVYNANTNARVAETSTSNLTVTNVSTNDNNSCVQISNSVCRQLGVYSFQVTLPSSTKGYILTYQRCCRNATINNIQNPGNTGESIFAYIPPSATYANNSPVFKNYPPIYICVNSPLTFDNSATDRDNDVLRYSLCSPYSGGSQLNPTPNPPSAPPYNTVTWSPPYSLSNIIGGVPLAIDSVTGLLTGTPNQIGQYIVGVCVSEYRNGELINTYLRDFQFNVIECNFPIAQIPSTNFNLNTGIGTYVVDCKDHTVHFNNTSYDPGSATSLSYQWNFGVTGTTTDTSSAQYPNFTYPDTGTYEVQLIVIPTGGSSCSDTTHAVVKIYPSFKANFGAAPTCAGPVIFTDSSTTTNTNGKTDYWNWDFGDNNTSSTQNPQHTYASQGNYIVTLIAGNSLGCLDTISKTVVVRLCSNATAVSGDTTICQGQTVTLNGPPSGAGGDYSWTPGGSTSPSITVSPNDTTVYVVSFTPLSGPTVVDTIVVNVNTTPVVTVPVTLACMGDSTSITAGVSPASLTKITFLWAPDGETTQTIRIAPDSSITYSVTVTSEGCSGYGSIALTVVSSPTVTAQANSNQCAAFVLASGSGGLSPYQYSINNGPYQSSDTFSNVIAGNYTVTVKDYHGCTGVSSSVSITPTTGLSFTTDTVGEICNGGNTGSITVTAAGATPPYQYSINNGAYQESTTFSSLIAGNYTVATKDTNGCNVSSVVTINQPAPITLTFDTINVTCNGASTGAIITTPSNGTPPYEYSLNNGNYQPSDTFGNLALGTYAIHVKDANSCAASGSVPIQQTFVLSFTVDTFNTGCSGATTGAIVVNVSAGTSPFQYSLDSNAFQVSDSFTNLAIGTYSIQVQDGNGCILLATGIGIRQATQVLLTATADSVRCFGGSDAIIIATATSGSMPYQFSVNSGTWQNSDTLTGLAAGSYTVTVEDINTCTAISSVQVYQPASALVLIPVQANGVLCPGDQNGSLLDSASGGTPPYNYSASSDGAIFHYGTGGSITGLDTGTYTVFVADDNGCIATGTGYIPNALIDSFSVTTDSTSCYGAQYTDGAILVTALSNTNLPYQFSLNNGQYQFSPDFTNLAKGVYNITAQNALGCITVIPPVTVYEATEGVATVYPSDTTLQLGQSVQLSNSFSPFPQDSIVSYFWTPSLGLSCVYCPDPVATPYTEENTYTLTITYNSHCTASAGLTILVQNNQSIFIPNSFTPNGDGTNDVFYVYGANIKTISLKVFDRWGVLVFESTNQLQGWDGTYKGAMQQAGVFTYTVSVNLLDNTQINKSGSITLLR